MGQTSSALASSIPESAPPLRILLDARKLGDGGIGVYIENTIVGLTTSSGVALSLLARPEVVKRYDFSGDVKIIPEYSTPYSISALLHLSKRIHWSEFDIYHSPHFTLPLNVPIPSVVTIHDIIHITSPERFFYPWIATPIIRNALKHATKIITVSETSRKEIIDVFGRELLEKITVIPNSLRVSLTKYSNETSLPKVAGIPSKYFLAVVSNTKPHKGFKDLIDAFKEVRHSVSSDIALVVVGLGRRNESEASSGIIELGEVDDSTLASLYAHAHALVVPSKIEGFCLPVIEAHSFGTPIVARPVPAISELAESADEVASSFSVPSLAYAMKTILLEPRRINKPLSPRFSVDSATEMLIDVYKKCAENI